MTPVEILKQCLSKGIELRCMGDNLKISGPKTVLTDELVSLLKEHKKEMLTLLSVMDTFKAANWEGTITRKTGKEVIEDLEPGVDWDIETRKGITFYMDYDYGLAEAKARRFYH